MIGPWENLGENGVEDRMWLRGYYGSLNVKLILFIVRT